MQGLDYAYTLQGWLKGVNGSQLNRKGDIGKDGYATGSNINPVAADAYGFNLNYYNTDYTGIAGAAPFAAKAGLLPTSADNVQTGRELFNGNINSMLVNIPKLGVAHLYGYQYDQLNRIVAMDAFTGLNAANNTFTPILTDNYRERITYDANGNIQTYKRNGDAKRNPAGGHIMDDMAYHYKPATNQLDNVSDAAPDAAAGEYDKYNDIKQGQGNGNYQYDAIGNLVSDASEKITAIKWTVYGKIATIVKGDATNVSKTTEINYGYDASGNRIAKTVAVKINSTVTETKSTFYVRDASGNTMSVYEKSSTVNTNHLTQAEVHLYGSSRLGVFEVKRDVENLLTANPFNNITTFERGNKFFELTNNLGNVLVTISDRKLMNTADATCREGTAPDYIHIHIRHPLVVLYQARQGIDFLPGFETPPHDRFVTEINPRLPYCDVLNPHDIPQAIYFEADVVTANDYYPGGMTMPGRKYQASPASKYRYSINGQEKSDEINENLTTALYWEYDSRILKRWNKDPKVNDYESPYLCFYGNPIQMADPDGDEAKDKIYRQGNKEVARQKLAPSKDSYGYYNEIIQVGPKAKLTTNTDGSISVSEDWQGNETRQYVKYSPEAPKSNNTVDNPSQAPINNKQQPAPQSTPDKSTPEKVYGVISGVTGTATVNSATAAVGSSEIRLSKILEKRLAYEVGTIADHPFPSTRTPVGPTTLSKSLNIRIPTNAAKVLSTTLKATGYALGALSVGTSLYEIGAGKKKLLGEGGIDLAFNVIGFFGPVGWAISLTYNVGKFALQETGNDFWNDKRKK